MIGKWRRRSKCFHHDWRTGVSWIKSQLIDTGRRKQFWCVACGKEWYV